MASIYVICFLVFALLNGWVQSAQWSVTSLPDGQSLYACAGDTVTLIWQYLLTSEEVLGDVQWLYAGQSQEMVAISTRGNFLSTPTFSQRVVRVDNAGLSLSRVLMPDSGNYSVEVDVYTQGGAVHNVLRRTTIVHVSDRLMTTDGVLHVTQLRDPVYDSVSSQWVIQLQCGNFIFKDNPPYQVQWTTPSGEVHSSSSFSNGNFYLSVPMPIESGSYTCRIPPHLSARACLHGNGTSEGQASVTVESVEARLLLLEKENWDLKHKLAHANSELASRLTSQNQSVADLASRMTQEVQRFDFQLNQTQIRLGKIEDAERNQVAFHAISLAVIRPPDNTPLLFSNVIYNQGNAYNPSTGYFTATYSGIYFFIAKTASNPENSLEYHYLMLESQYIDEAYTHEPSGDQYGDASPVHGVVHLTKGQRVYVTCRGNAEVWNSVSAFTGFLLSRDP